MMRHCFLVFIATIAVLPCSHVSGQQSDALKPEYIGVIYYLNTSANLLALDRQTPRPKASIKALGLGGAKAIVELEGEKASLRISKNQGISFVVGLPSGVDPRKIQLYPLTVKGGKRQLVLASGSIFSGQRARLPVQINISKYEEETYRLAPSSKLAAGEYVFMAEDSSEVFCFGVDGE